MSGSTNREGRVEVCVDGQWRAVCSNGWTQEQAGLLCSKLGHLSYGIGNIIHYRSSCIILWHPHLFCPGAEIRAFDPRRVPTLNYSIMGEQATFDLECNNGSDCIEDLGVVCLKSDLLEEILGNECSKSHVQAGER